MSDPGPRFGGVLLPKSCPGCRRVGSAPCPACIAQLRPPPDRPPPPGLDVLVALVSYEGVGATLVRRLKFANHRDALGALVLALSEQVRCSVPRSTELEGVTWVPTTVQRRRVRGFDQANLLAGGVAARLGLPCEASLRRLDATHQVGRGRTERLTGPVMVAGSDVVARRLLVVDDVVTTGASMAAAAAALRSAGASSVVGAALARTP